MSIAAVAAPGGARAQRRSRLVHPYSTGRGGHRAAARDRIFDDRTLNPAVSAVPALATLRRRIAHVS